MSLVNDFKNLLIFCRGDIVDIIDLTEQIVKQVHLNMGGESSLIMHMILSFSFSFLELVGPSCLILALDLATCKLFMF